MILAKPAILAARERGDLLIEPFDARHVRNASVDVTLGPWYWLETEAEYTLGQYRHIPTDGPTSSYPDDLLLNPYDRESVQRMWGRKPHRAKPIGESLPGIPVGSLVIPLGPGQNALCCTEQFIGANDKVLITKMGARSTMGRNQITVCRCAGMGDISFANRWTMEITNYGKRTVLLVCGRRIAQLWFLETTGIDSADQAYWTDGKYQKQSTKGMDLRALEAQWDPTMMLPKAYLDTEVTGE